MPEAAPEATSRRDPPDDRRIGRAVWALGLITAAVVVGQVTFYFARTVDDLFIALRYAEHLASGQGLVYNPGERVEGFSSPLWVALQALALWLGAEGVTATKLLSLASLGLLFAAAYLYGRRVLHSTQFVVWLVLATLAANSYLMSWALLGLETPLYLGLLVAWPLSLRLHLGSPSRRTLALVIASGIALGCARPEAPLYVTTLLLAVVLSRHVDQYLRQRARRLLVPVAIVASALCLLEVARVVYFGAWLPHTYYAKPGTPLLVDQLLPLVAQGARLPEILAMTAGLGACVWLSVRRIDLVPLVAFITNAVFVVNVAEDWMPNQRHYLPMWVFTALAAMAAIGACARRSWSWRPAAVAWGLVLAWCAVVQGRTDSRFSPKEFQTHGAGKHWVRGKRPEAWQDGLLALRRRTPPHVERMSLSGMGMIQQLFRILEASATPETESWYVSRDIGRVGYYSPVRVFDTDGLFTPAVTGDAKWRESGDVSEDLARAALAAQPVALEVFEKWTRGVGRLAAELDGYDVLAGSRRRPVVLVRRGDRPEPAEILRRYDRVAQKLPSWFYLATLYGESVGAAFDKRHAHVQRSLTNPRSYRVDAMPSGLTGSGVIFEQGRIALHGCAFSHASVAAGAQAELTCYFEARQRVGRDFTVFVHLHDPSGRRLLSADHAPCDGFHPTRDWPPHQIIEDRVTFQLPPDIGAPSLTAYVGLFHGAHRARATPADRTDGENRVQGPTLSIQR